MRTRGVAELVPGVGDGVDDAWCELPAGIGEMHDGFAEVLLQRTASTR